MQIIFLRFFSYGKVGVKRIIAQTIIFLFFFFYLNPAKADNINRYTSSIAIQIGLNGITQDQSSYELAFIPPDISYSHELFDNDFWNISTGLFYDNIGVKVKNGDQETNFSYRVGPRIDFGIELGKYTPYLTTGLGIMRNSHHYQTSPVYGGGFLIRLSKQILMVNEINFQDVTFRQDHYQIANFSTGLVYGF